MACSSADTAPDPDEPDSDGIDDDASAPPPPPPVNAATKLPQWKEMATSRRRPSKRRHRRQPEAAFDFEQPVREPLLLQAHACR